MSVVAVSLTLMNASQAAGRADSLAVREARSAILARHSLEGIHVEGAPGDPGEVILSGSVRSARLRNKALQVAWRAPGVRRLVDRVRIRPARSWKDVTLEARIYSVLDADPELGADDTFDVSVEDGIASIGGIVEGWRGHRRFTHDAFRAGAREVVNHMRVRKDPSGSERRFVYTRDPLGGAGAS